MSDDFVEGVVQKTSDYDQFKYLEANRQINKAHVQHLIHSFEENPEMAMARPVLVNQNFEIIDGQHRFQALKTLGMPVYYTMVKNMNVGTAQMLNALQKGWTVMDYARSYAMSGNSQYQQFLEYHEAYPLPVTVLMYFLAGHRQDRVNAVFRRGDFKVSKDKKHINMQLERMAEFGELFPHWRTYIFAAAAFKVLHTEGYDHDHMMHKLSQTPLKRQASYTDYIRAFEEIYNHYMPLEKQIRFY